MTRIIYHVFAIAVLVGVGGCTVSRTPEEPVSAPLALGWTDASAGKAIDLPSEDRISGELPVPEAGQPVLLNYWASTCPPCREEMPLLEDLQDKGVLVIGVTRDRYESHADKAIKKAGVTYPNFQDFDETYTSRELRDVIPTLGVPSSVLIVDGKIRQAHVGPFHSMADLRPVTDLLADN